MKYKTISCHYDTIFSLDHNNRVFIPRNVDSSRTSGNYNLITAGLPCSADAELTQCLDDYWNSYHILNDLYWSNRTTVKLIQDENYQQFLTRMRKYRQAQFSLTQNPLISFLTFLILPSLIPCEIYLQYQYHKDRKALDALKDAQLIRDLTFKASKQALRAALKEHDLQTASTYLHMFDSVVAEMAQCANNHAHTKADIDLTEPQRPRFATIEEIYEKVYEPSFREFQSHQRPCRRFNGTYLEYIRTDRAKSSIANQRTPNAKNRVPAEAIEFVIGIGDMDNTRYHAAYEDAKKAETLLKDFCDHLLTLHNICFVTTKELNDSTWQPPFRNGLIILNLTMHTDEATPGIHLTCIPYSQDCKRGPKIQATLGRTMTGMGYPSTWRDILDENGQPIPKRNKNGDIIYNKDGTIRYLQQPDKQGVIDWIEEQKLWLHKEMCRRYGWEREYKGSHPRGNLSTPDYKAAMAKKRKEEIEQLLVSSLKQYEARTLELSEALYDTVTPYLEQDTNQQLINRYLAVCSDEEYDAIVKKAFTYLDNLALTEQQKLRKSLIQQIQDADKRRMSDKKTHDLSYSR